MKRSLALIIANLILLVIQQLFVLFEWSGCTAGSSISNATHRLQHRLASSHHACTRNWVSARTRSQSNGRIEGDGGNAISTRTCLQLPCKNNLRQEHVRAYSARIDNPCLLERVLLI